MWGAVSQQCLLLYTATTVWENSLLISPETVCARALCAGVRMLFSPQFFMICIFSFTFTLDPSSCLFTFVLSCSHQAGVYLSFSLFCFCFQLLSMLINAAYKPGRVLKELQELEDQSWDCQEETLKAKWGERKIQNKKWQGNDNEHVLFSFHLLHSCFGHGPLNFIINHYYLSQKGPVSLPPPLVSCEAIFPAPLWIFYVVFCCCSGLCKVCIFIHCWLHRAKLFHSFRLRARCFLIENGPVFSVRNEKESGSHESEWVTCGGPQSTVITFMHECFDNSPEDLLLIFWGIYHPESQFISDSKVENVQYTIEFN